MASLFNFSRPLPSQINGNQFGVNTSTTFRVTSSFTLSSSVKAYSMLSGRVLLQQQSGGGIFDDRVNLILKPDVINGLKLPVKYIIYRGLDINDYLTSNIVADSATLVKTTGLEILDKMKQIQDIRVPGEDISVESLFGDELSPALTKKIDEFFFAQVSDTFSLFHIDGGVEIGNFMPGDVGIDIVLENPEYIPDVEMVRSPIFSFDVTAITNAAELKTAKDLVRHFIDPAAFYGLHIDIAGGIAYRDASGNPFVTTNRLEVFNQILNPFFTKNTVYLDLRNENGYSYNFYDNYLGSGTNANKEIKLGATSGSMIHKEYYTNGWPIFIIDVISPSSTLTENSFFIALRVNDNARPLLTSLFNKISPFTIEDKGIQFVDESQLLTSLITPLAEFTEPLSVSVPNIIDSGAGIQSSTIVRLDYFKQVQPQSTSVQFPHFHFSDFLFSPNTVPIPFDLSSNVQWSSSHHITYVDALSDGYLIGEMTVSIQSINVPMQEIVIVGEIPVYNKLKVYIENSGVPLNVGDYNVASVSISSGNTTVKTVEPIPGALQTGDKLKFSVYTEGQLDYTNNKFIIKGIDYSTLAAFAATSKIDFHTHYNFSNTYTVTSSQFVSANTEVLFSNTPKRVGFAGLMETGLILEADASTGGPYDDDRLMYYAAPMAYYAKDGVHDGFSFAKEGGASAEQSILEVLKKMMPGVVIDQVVVKPNLTTDIVTFKYSSTSPAKAMLYLLGITKTEFQSISLGTLVNHSILYRLELDGGRKSDINSVDYFKYELILCGLDATSTYTEVNSGIYVYTTDHLIFVSQAFAAIYGIDATLAAMALNNFLTDILTPSSTGSNLEELTHKTNEEIQNLKSTEFWNTYSGGVSNKKLFELDPTMAVKVQALKTALDATPESIPDLETIIQQKGAELFQYAKSRIKMPGENWTNKDGILYLTRLIMQLVIKNHPMVLTKFPSHMQQFSDIFEKHSRGLEGTEKPNFSGSTADFNFLVTGYDPFGSAIPGAYYDWQGHQSNSSGNLALSLDGEILTINHDGGPKTALIRSVVFPVRFREFDEGWIEDFFKPFIDDPNVDMIPTFSYGIDSLGNYDFEIEYYAARVRSTSSQDNDKNVTSSGSAYLDKTEFDDYEFLRNKLPAYNMSINSEIGVDQEVSFDFFNGSVHNNTNNVGFHLEANPNPNNIFNPTLIHEPNFGNYKQNLAATIPADRVKASSGPGGTYLSNEIFFRVALLRELSADPNKATGHLHLGYLKGDPSDNRTTMLTHIRQSLTNAIPALYDSPKTMTQFMKIVDTTYTNNDFFTGISNHTQEEKNQLSTIWQSNGTHAGNKEVFELDPTMKHKVIWFKKMLDYAPTSLSFSNAETIVQDAGSDLFNYAKKRIKQTSKSWGNKDGIIYITRLMMQVILKNHPKITSAFSSTQISDLYNHFEKYSRGLDGPEKPEFTRYPGTDKKILVTGFDPYGAGFDWQDHNSNSSGNLAMALDGTQVIEGGVTGNIRSAVFPVRYKEFDAKWVEDFITPYINDVNMIITFSYGIDTHDFQIDRFASNFRYGDLTDNDSATSFDKNLSDTSIPSSQRVIGDTFIENQLPWNEFAVSNILTIPSNPCVVGINHRAYWEVFADKITPPTANDVNITSMHTLNEQFIDFTANGLPDFNYWDNKYIIPIQKIAPFANNECYGNSQVSSDLKYLPGGIDEIKFPSWADYPDAGLTLNYGNFYIEARMGSGQYYHSNEIAYRVSNVRKTNNPTLKSGHIHIGFLHDDVAKGLQEDRNKMIEAANYMIKKMLNAL